MWQRLLERFVLTMEGELSKLDRLDGLGRAFGEVSVHRHPPGAGAIPGSPEQHNAGGPVHVQYSGGRSDRKP